MLLNLKEKLSFFISTIKIAFNLFQKNDPLRLGGATAFFANFAIPPILIILFKIFGFFTDSEQLVINIFDRMNTILDKDSITQIKLIFTNIKDIKQSWIVTIFSFLFLLFVATTLFAVIKNSLHQIWQIGTKDKPGLLFNLKLRGRSISIIILAGILFFIGILLDSIQAFFGSILKNASPSAELVLTSILNQFIFILIVTTWFSVLFRYLTNARPSWQVAISGGLLTGCLFTLGKYLLKILLPLSNIGSLYGASGSIVIIMLFIFYSAMIFYFGASFIKVLSIKLKDPIVPKNGSYEYALMKLDDQL